MPYFYDLEYSATHTTAGTPQTQAAGKQVAAGATLGLYGLMAAARSLTAGGGTVQTKTNNAVGFAQTGGTGGLQPIMQQAAVQVEGGTTPNPVDIEFVSNTVTSAVAFELTLEIGE